MVTLRRQADFSRRMHPFATLLASELDEVLAASAATT
jgi:hypothetical protein